MIGLNGRDLFCGIILGRSNVLFGADLEDNQFNPDMQRRRDKPTGFGQYW
jgi:hypothetical protein